MGANNMCVACGDTGLNSKGGLCSPCRNKGRQPLRDAALGAVSEVFAQALRCGRVPAKQEVVDAVAWAYEPAVQYAACFRGGGGMGMFAGPEPSLDTLLELAPPLDPFARPAFIVKLTRTTRGAAPIKEPVARWKGGKWQRRKK